MSCCVQGHPRLVKALANVYSPLLKRDVDPMTEVLVSVGAYGALFCIIQGMVNPGDEVGATQPEANKSGAQHRIKSRAQH